MAVWVISANPLFVETISQALADRLEAEILSATPAQALECIHTQPGQVLLIDEAVPPGMLKQILKQAQGLSRTRLILLNSTGNDFIVLDSYQVRIGEVDDLVRSIESPEAPCANLEAVGEHPGQTRHYER